MMTFALTVATEAAGLAVFVIGVCRLRHLHVVNYGGVAHHPGWALAYLGIVVSGLLAFFETHQSGASFALLVSQSAILGWLWLSQNTWRNGAPKWLEWYRKGENQ